MVGGLDAEVPRVCGRTCAVSAGEVERERGRYGVHAERERGGGFRVSSLRGESQEKGRTGLGASLPPLPSLDMPATGFGDFKGFP